jgi:serine/threonine-protein kinase/endoribonuclease IRE1
MTLLADVAAGLAALHARAIVHRDLKPHNVLITDSCRAKLSDMGLSKQLVAEQSSFESHGAGARFDAVLSPPATARAAAAQA